MTTLSSLGSGVKSIQTDYIGGTSWDTYGTGEDASYLDITLSTAVDPDKCVIHKDMVASNVPYAPISSASSSYTSFQTTARMIDSTTLRISCGFGSASFKAYGRYTVIEYY